MFDVINLKILLFSALLFFLGYALAPTAYYKEIRWITIYPMWIVKKLDTLSKKSWKPVILFFFLFTVNSFSLLVDLLSAAIPFLPFIFAIWTGINIGVVTYHTLEGNFYFTALINPVAIFELPAAFLTFTMAIQYNLTSLGITSVSTINWTQVAFGRYLLIFMVTVIPILFVAGIIETYLIHLSEKIGNGEDRDD